MNILLDFDGVLFDSSWEVTAIILAAYYLSFPNSNISKYLEKTETLKVLLNPQNYSPKKAFKILSSENYKLNKYFRKFRTYCTDVDDFFVISNIVNNNLFKLKNLTFKTINDKFYYELKSKSDSENLKVFINNFYQVRRIIKENNYEFWISLNQPFKKEVSNFLKLSKKYNTAILSTKQKYAILAIFDYYKIHFDSDKVFAKENEFVHKGKKIKEIVELWQIKGEDLHFVDDLLANLLNVKEFTPKVNLYITSWGYSNYTHRILAKKNSIKIINSLSHFLNN